MICKGREVESWEQLCEEEVGKEDEHGGANDGISGSFSHFDGTAFDAIAVESRNRGDDESKEEAPSDESNKTAEDSNDDDSGDEGESKEEETKE